MASILEYTHTMGKIPLDQAPFNEVDALVLSQFAYLSLEDMVTFPCKLADLDRGPAYIQHIFGAKETLALLQGARTSKRFGPLRLLHQYSILDFDREEQYASTLMAFAEHHYILAWRGTDTTFVGWKEDTNMAYQKTVASQTTGLAIFQDLATLYPGTYTLIGHSKGGTIATYVATNCPKDLQDKITAIYNFDGPSLHPDLVQSPAYQRIQDRIHKYIPQESIYGLIWEETTHYQVIQSQGSHLAQHSASHWLVEDDHFRYMPTNTSFSRTFQEGLLQWLKTTDNATKARSFQAIYHLTLELGTPYIEEAVSQFPQSLIALFKGAKYIDLDARKLLKMIGNLIIASSIDQGNVVLSRFVSSLSRIWDKDSLH